MRIRVVGSIALLLAVSLTGPAIAATSPPRSSSAGPPEVGPLLSGTASYVHGTFAWTGYAYNDHGANTSSGGEGTATYPGGQSNTANLIQLQLAQVTGGTRVTAILETLVDPSLPLLGVGFDTDGNPNTGAPCLPGGYWKCKGSLGLERLLVIDSLGGRLLAWTGSTWHASATFPAKVDAANNTMTTTIPAAVMPPLGSAPWRVVAALGLTTRSWLTGGPIYDLAYVHDDRFTGWQDSTQADVLSGYLDASAAAATVNPRLVTSRATKLAEVGPGYHTFLYHSTLNLPEGVTQNAPHGTAATNVGIVAYWYLGPYQPYGVWVPARLPDGPVPLLAVLHGSGSNHLTALSDFAAPAGVTPIAGTPASTVNLPGANSGLFDVPAIMVSPLARGESTYDWGIAEQDILDVISNVEHRFPVDQNHVVLSGISLGSLGTWRLGELYPDRFSALVPIIAASEFPPENAVVGRHIFPNALENVGNLVLLGLGGRLDPLADPFTGLGQERDFAKLAQLGYGIKFWWFIRRNHEVVPGPSNCVYLEALSHPRDANPARVVYTTERDLEMSDPSVGLNLSYRSSYWVTGLAVRTAATDPAGPIDQFAGDPNMKGTIDVVSLARKDRTTTLKVLAPTTGQDISAPANVCGTSQSQARGQDAWYELQNEVTAGAPQPVTNGLQMTLTNLSAVTFNLARASVTTGKPVTLIVSGDGPVSITLLGPWHGPVSVTRDGAGFGTFSPSDGGVVIGSDYTGTHTFVVTMAQ